MSTQAINLELNKKIVLPLEWPYRLLGNFIILCFVFGLAIITVTIKEEIVSKKISDLTEYFYEKSNKAGLTIDDITIENREKTPLSDIEKALGLNREKNILSTDVANIKKELEKLPWIKKATIKRGFFPNTIHISLVEKEVESLWQINNKFFPIDEDGKVIEADFTPKKPTLLIVGTGAPENFKNLIQIIKKDEEIYRRIKVANFISGRRWNIILDDIETGITIKLPETNLEENWDRLIKMNTTKGIFKRKLTIIDLRLPNKVIVKIGKINSEDKNKLKNTKESKI